MKICKCSCHYKGLMTSMDCYLGCCNHPDRKYLNADGTIDKKDMDAMIEQSIKDWHKNRKEIRSNTFPLRRKDNIL